VTTAPRHALPTARGRQTRAAIDVAVRVAIARRGIPASVDDGLAEYRSDICELPMCRGDGVDA
jgi:hypothetical protein